MLRMKECYPGLAVVVSMCVAPWCAPAGAQCYPEEIDILFSSDAAPGDLFGCSVAISGDFAFIAACGDDNENGVDAGSVYVFLRSGDTWVEQPSKLTASDGAAGDFFGSPVVVSGDTLMVGAPMDGEGELVGLGSVYVFVRSGEVWIQQQKFTANDPEELDLFSWGIAIEGDTAVIGAPEGFNPPTATGSGSAYVFTRSGGVWTQAAKLTASDADLGDYFGLPPSISGDTILIGAHANDPNEGLVDAGSVYVFEKPVDGWTDMTETQRLIPSDAAPGDGFGLGGIHGDTALIGAWKHDHTGGYDDAGATYVFVRSGNGWVEQPPELTASDAQPQHFFGGAIHRGAWALIGAPGDDDMGPFAGAVYLFVHSLGVWTEAAKLTGSESDEYADFGRGGAAVTGNTVLIGDPADDNAAGSDAGAVYVFELNCTLPGDCDGDIDVDLEDLGALVGCLKGPGVAHGPGCGCLDFEDDGDVDLYDFSLFQRQFTGQQP